eukprot:545264_1
MESLQSILNNYKQHDLLHHHMQNPTVIVHRDPTNETAVDGYEIVGVTDADFANLKHLPFIERHKISETLQSHDEITESSPTYLIITEHHRLDVKMQAVLADASEQIELDKMTPKEAIKAILRIAQSISFGIC